MGLGSRVGLANYYFLDDPGIMASDKLPSFADMLQASKKKKGLMSSVKGALITLANTDLLELSEAEILKLSEGEILCWLYEKFDVGVVDKIRALYSYGSSISPQWIKIVSGLINFEQELLEKILSLLQPKFENDEVPLILSPPISTCFDCGCTLVSNHVTAIRVYTLRGFKAGTKFTLRCKSCNIYYNYANFGNKRDFGFRYYPTERHYVEASDTVYFSRNILHLQCSLA